MSRVSTSTLALCAGLVASLNVSALPINSTAYASLTGTQLITFDDVAGGGAPGTNYDAIFESGNTAIGEHFVGQTVGVNGDSDTLAGAPTAPLTLTVGAPGQNLNVFTNTSQVLTGLGPRGFPDFSAIGEGAFAVLFDFDQSEFGFQLVGGNGGNGFVSFFRRNGTLIDSLTIASLADDFYGFTRDGGLKDIAGVSIYNDDGGGVGFDNLKFDVAGVIGDPNAVPEPTSLAVAGLGLLGLSLSRRRPRFT